MFQEHTADLGAKSQISMEGLLEIYRQAHTGDLGGKGASGVRLNENKFPGAEEN